MTEKWSIVIKKSGKMDKREKWGKRGNGKMKEMPGVAGPVINAPSGWVMSVVCGHVVP
jgi:hypothetical protein